MAVGENLITQFELMVLTPKHLNHTVMISGAADTLYDTIILHLCKLSVSFCKEKNKWENIS